MPTRSRTNRQQVQHLLARALPPARLALLEQVSQVATARALPLYLVGGFVRDLLLGRAGLDLDLVVEGDALALGRSLVSEFGGSLTVHARFSTARWQADGDPGRPLDLITARREHYARPGALPTVHPGTLTDDLRRRDFTINALAVRLDGDHLGELRDDLNGLEDLRRGTVRVLHPLSYRDDPTRILRAARYESRYDFQIPALDLAWIEAARPLLARLSGERLRHELDLALEEADPARLLARLAQLGILREIHPCLGWDEALAPFFARLERPEPESWRGIPDLRGIPRRVALGYLVWLSDLDPLEVEPLAARLDLTAGLRQALSAAADLRRDLPELVRDNPSRVVARLEGLPLLSICALTLRSDADQSAVLEQYLAAWRHVKPRTTGQTLKRYGLAPGPAYRAILKDLRDAWLDGLVRTPAQENQRLQALVRQVSSIGISE